MTRLLPAVLIALNAALLAASRGDSHQPSANQSQRRAELQNAHELLATRAAKGDFVGAIASVIAPQGFYVSAVATLGKGPAAARTFLERDTLNARSRALLAVVRLDVSADGNDGFSYGYLDVIRPGGDTVTGAYKAYWRRAPDGRWQVLAIGRGPREHPTAASAPPPVPAFATVYKSWPGADSIASWTSLKAAEIAFSDSSATDIRAAFMSFAAPDAGKVGSAHYVFGREAIGEGFRNPPPGFSGITWHAEYGTVAASNDLGFNVGPVGKRGAAAGQSQPGGMFFTIWRRQPNGDWKYVVD